ncbi:hypothetical protein FQN50_004058 [Emmonsiellopsis sp. PD_5]|nr:hypothetical protein FQN50_004058 [Emmonsiellopsis sp. PD_5]
MSFQQSFEGLKLDSRDDGYRHERGPEPYGQPPPGYGGQLPYPQQPPYGQATYGQQQPYYGQQPPYGQQAPSEEQRSYGSMGPAGPPPGYPPPLPEGWIQRWDQNYQRAYYVEQATGRPYWEAPFNSRSGHEGSRGLAEGYYGGEGYSHHSSHEGEHSKHHEEHYGHESKHHDEYHGHGHGHDHEKKEGFSTGAMVAAGAAGVAVGAVGGALIAHELGALVVITTAEESGDEKEPLPDLSEGAPPPPEDYPEDASSSDVEELQEAYEEVFED